MSLNSLVAGDYGQAIELTFLDVDTNLAADISAYTSSQQMVFTKPDGKTVTKTATFKTTGVNGIIQYTVEPGLLTAGTWGVRGRVASGSAVLSTEREAFEVLG